VLRFVAGFVSASLLWGGFVYGYSQGLIDISLEPDAPPEATATDVVAEPEAPADKSKRPRRRKAGSRSKGEATPMGDSLTGDDLGENDARSVDMNGTGGEEQLRGTEIEQGFDSVFSQVRRCLVLAAGDEPVQGKVVFGLRVAGTGRVKAVNLNGPSAVTQGDSGACLRKAASSIQFRSFNGPDMVVHYPLTLQ
jgi:hypothetical protein